MPVYIQARVPRTGEDLAFLSHVSALLFHAGQSFAKGISSIQPTTFARLSLPLPALFALLLSIVMDKFHLGSWPRVCLISGHAWLCHPVFVI